MFEKFEFSSTHHTNQMTNAIALYLYQAGFGGIAIAIDLLEALGMPDYVDFYLDEDDKLIGIKASSQTNLTSRPVKASANSIAKRVNCTALLKFLNVVPGSRCRLPAHYDPDKGMVIANYTTIATGGGGP